MESGEMMAVANAVFNRYFGCGGVEREDLVMEGVCGIIRAIGRFDSGKGKLLTYVWECCHKSMLTYYNRQALERRNRCDVEFEDVAATLQTDDCADFYDGVADVCRKAIECFGKISDKKKCIIEEIVGGEESKNISKMFGVSRQYVSSIYCEMKRKMMQNYYFRDGELIEKKKFNEKWL